MTSHREETWGHVLYDPVDDEFSAHLSEARETIHIDRPLSAGCLVTGRCNLRCRFCYGNAEGLPVAEMSVTDWARAFRRLRRLGLMRVDLSGGEPTLRRDLPDIASAAMSEGLNVVVSTNGMLWHAAGPPPALPPAVRIHVSLDSGLEAVHEASRLRVDLAPSRASFHHVGNFIRKAIERGHRLRVLTCVGPHNQRDLFELGELLALAGVHEWNVSQILPAGRALADHEARWRTDTGRVREQLTPLRAAYPWLQVRYSNRVSTDRYFLLVLPDGTVATQTSGDADKVALGTVHTLTLEELQGNADFDLRAHAGKWLASFELCGGLCWHAAAA